MKETKVYVDGELLKYTDLSLCCTKDFDNKFYTNNYSLIDNEEYFEATFKDIKELINENHQKIIKFIDELAWQDIQYDAFQSTIGEFSGSTGSIPRYAKKYFKLWKEMFGEDLEEYERSMKDEQI